MLPLGGTKSKQGPRKGEVGSPGGSHRAEESRAFLTQSPSPTAPPPSKKPKNSFSLVGKTHKQSASDIKGLRLCGKRHFCNAVGVLSPQLLRTVRALSEVGVFYAQNLNQSATNCFFEKRCLLNNFNCHKMTKMGFKN